MTVKSSVVQTFSKLILLALSLMLGCRDPFIPDVEFKETNFLVVEGFINMGSNAVTKIQLSRTVSPTQANSGPLMETGASILIEDDNNNAYTLFEGTPGIYFSDPLNLPVDRKYRLTVTTASENTYVSDFTEPLITPPIESVTWKAVPAEGPIRAVEIYVNSHDLQVKADYYQWDYEEIFERRMEWPSELKWEDDMLVHRDNSEQEEMRLCYEHKFPRDLIIAPATQFKNGVISQRVISFPVNDVRLHRMYAITVTQNVLSRKAYDYLRIMLKNTNSMGTFFDPLPSGLSGNIRNLNSSEPVVGFVIAYQTSAPMRLMISSSDVPWWNFQYGCDYITIDRSLPDQPIYFNRAEYVSVHVNNVLSAASVGCGDCRWWGGNNLRPDFWPEPVGDDE
jgi:hypothetical protein